LDYQMGWKDVFFAKRYLHKYFREKTGESYTKVLLQAHQSPRLDIPKKMMPSLNTYDFSDIHRYKKEGNIILRDISQSKDRFLFSQVMREDFFSVVDLDDPFPLRYVDHPFVERLVREYYDHARKGLLDYVETMDIYNLEIFLRNLNNNGRE